MGYRLVAEVLDHAPPDLTPAEVGVLIAIAAEARDDGRTARPGMEVMMHRTRLSRWGVTRALQRLRDRGLEVRTNVAHRGQRTVYRLPFFVAGRVDSRPPNHLERVDGGPPESQERVVARPPKQPGRVDSRPPKASERVDSRPPKASERVDGGPPLSVSTKQQQRSARIVMDATDATEAEALAVAELVATERKPKSIHAYLIHLVRDEEIGDWLDRVRANGRRVDVAAELEQLRRRDPCEHGDPGGDQLHPTTGLPLCPKCRRLNQRSA